MMLVIRLMHTSYPRLKTVPSNLKGKSRSSQEWLTRQLNDPYVKKAREMGYRARSVFKLIEMDDKLKILKPGQVVIECGAAPGAWTQIIVKRINSDAKNVKKAVGKVIGIDLLPISPLNGAILLPGMDFTSKQTQSIITGLLQGHSSSSTSSTGAKLVDLVLSDMAPNATGMGEMDHYQIVKLVEKALEFAVENGKEGSHFLTKIWDGIETKKIEAELAKVYRKVGRLKPPCSRDNSAEIFLFAKEKK